MMTWPRFFGKQCRRELLLHLRQPSLIVHASLFFLMVAVFFPLTMPPKIELLRSLAPGLVWIALLLSTLLTSFNLFQQEYEDGLLELWFLSADSLTLILTAKLLIHWLVNLLPLLFFCPILALLFHLKGGELIILVLSLLVGSPTILFLCGFAAAFGTGIKHKNILMTLILLPLTIPVMILGSGSLTALMQDLPVASYFAFLAAITLLSISFLPFAIAAVLRATSL